MSILTKGLGSNLLMTKGLGYYIGRTITKIIRLYSMTKSILHLGTNKLVGQITKANTAIH